MKELFPPIKEVNSLCGEQTFFPQQSYRLSKHCISIPCEDGILRYQTLTGALYLEEIGEDPSLVREELVRTWLYVPADYDEMKLAKDTRKVLRALRPKSKNKTGFTILTTTDCNARCFYCFEKGCKRVSMSEKTALDVADYIASVCGEERVDIQWFGGEPLFNHRAIEIISTELQRRGIVFTSKIVSNGYLLNAALAHTAKTEWHVKWIQITLDGTAEIYNRTKAYVNCKENAFERVLQNIGIVLDEGIPVYVRLNMDRKNAENLNELVDLLADRIGRRKGFNVCATLLIDYDGSVNTFASEEEAIRTRNALQNKINSIWGVFANKLIKEPVIYNCQADNDACETILPDGSIQNCEDFSEEETIGTIYSTQRDSTIIQAWKETDFFPECADCPLFPQCVYLKKCRSNGVRCGVARRKYLLFQLEERIKEEYRKYKSRLTEAAT